jgi:hypothetical protein
MYKFEPNQSNEQVFKVAYWHLLVERFQEVFDYELTELMKSDTIRFSPVVVGINTSIGR